MPELFEFGVKTYGNPKFLNYRGPDGTWHAVSAKEAADKIRHLALGFHLLGIKEGDRVILLSENRPEWSLTDLAILSIGGIIVPIYTSQPPSQIEFILSDCKPQWVVVSNRALYDRALPALEKCEMSDKIVTFQAVPPIPRSILLDEVEASGKKQDASLYDKLKSGVKPENLASIVYTSDQSGIPKGVMLTHSNFVSNVLSCAGLFSLRSESTTALSYLPLSHVFERMILYHYFYRGISVYYAESIERVTESLVQVKPTIMTTVPRLLEKVEERMLARARKFPFLGKLIFNWCVKVAKSFEPEKLSSFFYRLVHKVVDFVLYGTLRKRFGGRLTGMISGGARLRPDLARLFTAAGIPIYQGYGLTETSPVISTNYPGKNRIGSVGPIVPGVTVKIAEDGEICVTGPNVMQGYYNNKEATSRVLEGGWFKTGDIGYIDSEGFLFITDRKKDLMKTSGGKYVVPQVIEDFLKKNNYVGNAVVFADGRKFVSALLFPDMKKLGELAVQEGLRDLSCEWLINQEKIRDLYEEAVSVANQHLSPWETVKKYAVVCDNISTLSAENLTPRQFRKKVEERYRDLIESFYTKGEGAQNVAD